MARPKNNTGATIRSASGSGAVAAKAVGSAVRGRPVRFLAVAPTATFTLAPGMTRPGDVALAAAIDTVVIDWVGQRDTGRITPLTYDRMAGMLRRFGTYAAARGIVHVADITPALCADFVNAGLAGPRGRASAKRGAKPATGTMAHRRAAVRTFFATCHRLGLDDRDPTRGIKVSGYRRNTLRPLTPAEVDRAKKNGRARPRDTRRPALLALMLCGASVAETAWVTIEDVTITTDTTPTDPASGVPVIVGGAVYLAGRGGRFIARTVTIDAWAAATLDTRIAALHTQFNGKNSTGTDLTPDGWPVAFPRPAQTYPATHIAPMAGQPITRLLAQAGVGGPAEGIRPSSLPEYAANRVYAITGSIEQVAAVMGIRSLDSAKRLIDPDWQNAYAAIVRAQAGVK